jgi:hypothetical protein
MAVDADTKKFLDEVKKGKSRRFVMICKGVKIVSLIVYKKGNEEKYKKEAKTEGKGTFYAGVVTGKGVNISFQLSRDRFDSPPVSDLILKTHLESETGMKFKPRFEIVELLSDVDDVDPADETTTEHPASAPGAEAEPILESAAPPSPPTPPTSGMSAFAGRLKTHKQELDQVLAAQTAVSGQVKSLASEMGTAAKRGDFDAANRLLDQVVTLVQDGLAELAMRSTSAEASAATFTERLKRLKPQIDRAMTSGTTIEPALKRLASEAATLARQKDFQHASQVLDKIELLLSGTTAEFQAAEPVTEQGVAAEGEFVRYTKSRLAWDDARKTAHRELAKLQQAMLDDVTEDDSDRQDVVKAVQRLDGLLSAFDDKLSDKLDDALNAAGDDRRRHHNQAVHLVGQYLRFLNSHPIILAIDSNPFAPVRVRETLAATLTDIASQLES